MRKPNCAVDMACRCCCERQVPCGAVINSRAAAATWQRRGSMRGGIRQANARVAAARQAWQLDTVAVEEGVLQNGVHGMWSRERPMRAHRVRLRKARVRCPRMAAPGTAGRVYSLAPASHDPAPRPLRGTLPPARHAPRQLAAVQGARERCYWWQITISQRVFEFGNRPQRRAQTRQRQDITARGAVPSCDARRDKIAFGALHSRACTRKGRRGPAVVARGQGLGG